MAAPGFSFQSQTAARLANPALRAALSKYARRRLPPGEVEDLVQNTLICALASSGAPSDDGEFQRWVHGIARHKIADSYRRRGRLPTLVSDPDAGTSDFGPETRELAEWIESELPASEGADTTLRWLLRESDGESLDEIARDARLPAPRVRQRVSRLRRHFHSRWLALGATGFALLLAAGFVLRAERKSTPAPSIVRESASPLERARRLRKYALEKCAEAAYSDCVVALDQAQTLDPLGDEASAVRDARKAAASSASGAPTPPESPRGAEPKSEPKRKTLPQAPSKQPAQKPVPNSTPFSKLQEPSWLPAETNLAPPSKGKPKATALPPGMQQGLEPKN